MTTAEQLAAEIARVQALADAIADTAPLMDRVAKSRMLSRLDEARQALEQGAEGRMRAAIALLEEMKS